MFGAVFKTRFLHYYALAGMLFLAIGIVVVNGAVPPTAPLLAVGSGLIGIGVGAAVVPALFIAGFSLRSNNIQRVFAIIELIRAVAAFMIAPVLLHAAVIIDGNFVSGAHIVLWICFGISLIGAVVGAVLYAAGGVRPPTPRLAEWSSGAEPGWYTPPLFAKWRARSSGS